MFLTSDDVFLIAKTLGIVKEKEKNMEDRVDETYMFAQDYDFHVKEQLGRSLSPHLRFDITPYNIHTFSESEKDYFREYKLTYLKGNFN